jgi:pilus assembly protein CpaF
LREAQKTKPSKENKSMQETNRAALFSLGQIVATPGALAALAKAGQTPLDFLTRHVCGDWGELDPHDQKENELGLKRGFRLLSSYRTSSGDTTTLLSLLGRFIPDDERILLIEDTAEIHLDQKNLVRFEARRPQNDLPAVTIRDLLKAALRHRPDRIILGEIRGGEAFDLLQLLNTGHSGSLSTVHANSARQALARFESCILQSGVELPHRAIKTNVGHSLNVVVQLERRPGRRYVSEVVQINGYDADRDEYDLGVIFSSHGEPS